MKSDRAQMFDVMSGVQLQAIDKFIDSFEREAIEDLIHAAPSDVLQKQERVRTVREIREQFKPPKGAGGQA